MDYKLKTITLQTVTKLENKEKNFCWHCRLPMKANEKVMHHKNAGRSKAHWFHKDCYDKVWQ